MLLLPIVRRLRTRPLRSSSESKRLLSTRCTSTSEPYTASPPTGATCTSTIRTPKTRERSSMYTVKRLSPARKPSSCISTPYTCARVPASSAANKPSRERAHPFPRKLRPLRASYRIGQRRRRHPLESAQNAARPSRSLRSALSPHSNDEGRSLEGSGLLTEGDSVRRGLQMQLAEGLLEGARLRVGYKFADRIDA